MAIDKAVNPLGNPSEVDIEIINPDAVIIREDDDGFLAILGPELSEQIMPDFDANLAEHMDERELNGLGFELLDDFESDSRSRQDWEDTYKKGLDLLGLKIEELKLASQIDLQKADIALRSTIEEGNSETFGKAIDAQAGLKANSGWASDVLALFRPGLTLALWVSSMILAVWYRDSNPELMSFIITSTFGMFSISVGYWFGVRTEQKMAIRAVK